MALKLGVEGSGKVSDLVTGTVMAFLGSLDEHGSLVVTDFCSPGLPPQRSLSLDPGLCLSASTCVCVCVCVCVCARARVCARVRVRVGRIVG